MRLFRVLGIGSSATPFCARCGREDPAPTHSYGTANPATTQNAGTFGFSTPVVPSRSLSTLPRCRRFQFLRALDNGVDETVLLCLLRRHVKVTIGVPLNPFQRLPAVLGQYLVQSRAHAQDLPRFNLNVARLSRAGLLRPRLVDQDR